MMSLAFASNFHGRAGWMLVDRLHDILSPESLSPWSRRMQEPHRTYRTGDSLIDKDNHETLYNGYHHNDNERSHWIGFLIFHRCTTSGFLGLIFTRLAPPLHCE